MTYPTFIKDPSAILDYGQDWSQWLEDGETITTSTWTVPAGLTKVGSDTHDATTTTVWLSGGTVADDRYTLTNHVVTSASRADDRSITIVIRER